MAKKIFVGYDHKNSHYETMLSACNVNDEFDFVEHADIPINSKEADALKQLISEKIKKSAYFLCIVDKHTHESDWVNWEIKKALESGGKIVVLKTEKDSKIPAPLCSVNAEQITVQEVNKIINYQSPKEAPEAAAKKLRKLTLGLQKNAHTLSK